MTNTSTENSIFQCPPNEPIMIIKQWLDEAKGNNVLQPGAMALTTVSSSGKPSSRIVQLFEFRGDDIVFATHTTSQKAKDITDTGVVSAILYFRETKQQIIFSGKVQQLSSERSDEIWKSFPSSTYPMSVASKQSVTLEDEEALRKHAQELTDSKELLSRPKTWCGYSITMDNIEFWQAANDRLHLRLCYKKNKNSWINYRLQP